MSEIGDDLTLAVFTADWCAPCKAIGPTIDQLATEYEGKARIVRIDVEEDSELALKHGVMAIPALLVFKDGKVVEQRVGAAPKQQIADMIDRALKDHAGQH